MHKKKTIGLGLGSIVVWLKIPVLRRHRHGWRWSNFMGSPGKRLEMSAVCLKIHLLLKPQQQLEMSAGPMKKTLGSETTETVGGVLKNLQWCGSNCSWLLIRLPPSKPPPPDVIVG